MFACLYSISAPLATLLTLAADFTPRFAVVGPLVILDVSGLSRLIGTPREIGEQLRRSAHAPIRIAIAPTQTAAALLALGRPGLTVIAKDDQRAALAALTVDLLGRFEQIRLGATGCDWVRPVQGAHVPQVQPPHVAHMEDVLPYFQSSLDRTSESAAAPHRPTAPNRTPLHPVAPVSPAAPVAPVSLTTQAPACGGWSHPRDAHAAAHTRRDNAHAPLAPLAPRVRSSLAASADLLATLRRWGVRTFGQLAALPPGEVYERLGARGITWQRQARGDDLSPLVPWTADDPFEESIELEWPIEGLEPLSFVLARLLEPLSERLERADRGAAILSAHLRLVDKTVCARTLQLPAPMRDPKTLRTLLLLDLETHPPSAAIDRVRVIVEPTPARVTQWALFERAQPSPEQVSTLLARLTALMGDTHVGSPRLVDSWKPGVFEMTPFEARSPASAFAPAELRRDKSARSDSLSELRRDLAVATFGREGGPVAPVVHSALRRFRLPIPARVQVAEGRPVRIVTDRRGVTGGPIVQVAGPWRTSGEWWNDGCGRSWNRDEWDAEIADGTVYRLYVERDIGQWFLEGVVD